MQTTSRKLELYREAQRIGGVHGSFAANIILTGMSNPTKKLAGLVVLLRAGHEVSVQQFDICLLTIDGRMGYSYAILEACAKGDTSALAAAKRDDQPGLRAELARG
jgi:hypothetical protein